MYSYVKTPVLTLRAAQSPLLALAVVRQAYHDGPPLGNSRIRLTALKPDDTLMSPHRGDIGDILERETT